MPEFGLNFGHLMGVIGEHTGIQSETLAEGISHLGVVSAAAPPGADPVSDIIASATAALGQAHSAHHSALHAVTLANDLATFTEQGISTVASDAIEAGIVAAGTSV